MTGYNEAGGGVISSTGFFLNNVTTTEYFFDDDGSGNLRIYSLVGNTRTYANSNAGTVDYENGLIKIGSITITGVGFVDDASSSQIRVTALPRSNDITPVRNQILEIDFVNSTITSAVDVQQLVKVIQPQQRVVEQQLQLYRLRHQLHQVRRTNKWVMK